MCIILMTYFFYFREASALIASFSFGENRSNVYARKD